MTTDKTKATAGYVLTSNGEYLAQIPDANDWGFSLCDEDQSWPGGIGVAGAWRSVPDIDVPEEHRERLGWILDDHRNDDDDNRTMYVEAPKERKTTITVIKDDDGDDMALITGLCL